MIINGTGQLYACGKINVGGNIIVSGDGQLTVDSGGELTGKVVKVKGNGTFEVRGKASTGSVLATSGYFEVSGELHIDGTLTIKGDCTASISGKNAKVTVTGNFSITTSMPSNSYCNEFSDGQLWIGGNFKQGGDKTCFKLMMLFQ